MSAFAQMPYDGTEAHPFLKLADAFNTSAVNIYVCTGDYMQAGPLDVHSGVSMYGGLSCTNWTYSGGLTHLFGNSGPILRYSSPGIASLSDVDITPAGTNAGDSSVGVVVTGLNDNLTLTNVRISAGPGQNGANSTIQMPVVPAPGGGNGSNGVQGPGGSQKCGMTDVNGGWGGADSGMGSDGSPSGLGGGGGAGNPCKGGGPGAGGIMGAAQTPNASSGKLDDTGYVGPIGMPGLPGSYGGGGGGGGGGLLSGGGGGGAGGCGGAGGAPGSPGGASIPLIVVDGNVQLGPGVTLVATNAGNGGTGAAGQLGQLGGGGGTGGCTGGTGGQGGQGGPGSGGSGGVSAEWATAGVGAVTGVPTPTSAHGSAGVAGMAGGVTGKAGMMGFSCIAFDATTWMCAP